jgi:hypothetical protein
LTSKTLTFPPKKLKIALDETDVGNRKKLLQRFLSEIVSLPHLASAVSFVRFIDPLEKPSVYGLQLMDVQLESSLWALTELPFNQVDTVSKTGHSSKFSVTRDIVVALGLLLVSE